MTASQCCRGLAGLFLIEDWENVRPDDDRTRMAWCRSFEAAWPDLQRDSLAVVQRFWGYDPQGCTGFFRSCHGQLWPVVISKPERSTSSRSWRPGWRTPLLAEAK